MMLAILVVVVCKLAWASRAWLVVVWVAVGCVNGGVGYVGVRHGCSGVVVYVSVAVIV